MKKEQKPFEISLSLVVVISFIIKLLLQACFILVRNNVLICFQKASGFDIFSSKRFLWYLLIAVLITLLTLFVKVLYRIQSLWFFDLLALRNNRSWSFICFLISLVSQGQGFPLIVFFVNGVWVSVHLRRISLIYCQHIFESRQLVTCSQFTFLSSFLITLQ